MSIEVLSALIVFAFVSSVTPGPNNMMLLASGVNFGFRRTIPHICGIELGFAALVAAMAFGLGALFELVPVLHTLLKVIGGAYLVWIAWSIASSRSLGQGEGAGRPMSFWQAAAFQWVNPKAWVMVISAITAYAGPSPNLLVTGLLVAVFAGVGFPAVSIWAAFGALLRDWLADPRRLKLFNLTMAALLLASLWPVLR
ncbi:LysE family translocator [Oryzibacter oryziterrae]|uniref:LysE family translocator n=1 Tax=Oryzibacter oryziterrae TaxID=2766474 RepID=UPI001F173307|nr:LysE family translocator [Oryzibacter oryziterrae]